MSTLKEKFYKEIRFMERAEICEKIADDYAIEFLIFEHKAFSGKVMNYEYAKAMLENFKKQNGYV